MINLNEYYISSEFQGASDNNSGVAGYVPQALPEDRFKFLRGDGTWQSRALSYDNITSNLSAGLDVISLSATSAYLANYPIESPEDAYVGSNNLVKRDNNGKSSFGSIGIGQLEGSGIVNNSAIILDINGVRAGNLNQNPAPTIQSFDAWTNSIGIPLFRTLPGGTTGQSTTTSFGFYAGAGTNGQNTFFGFHAGESVTTGRYNTVVGYYALNSNTAGNYNVAVGLNALRFATGSSNVAVGFQAGGSSNNKPTHSVFIGTNAGLIQNGTGQGNVCIGNAATIDATNRNHCIVLGREAVSGNENGTLSIGKSNYMTGLITNQAPEGLKGDYLRIWLNGTEYRIPIQKAS